MKKYLVIFAILVAIATIASIGLLCVIIMFVNNQLNVHGLLIYIAMYLTLIHLFYWTIKDMGKK